MISYGSNYFRENGSNCLCRDCTDPPIEEGPSQQQNQINLQDQQEAKRVKRLRQREKRKLGHGKDKI
jgi:hypothetical protein